MKNIEKSQRRAANGRTINRPVCGFVFLFLTLSFLLISSDSRRVAWPPVPEFCPQLASGSLETAAEDYDAYREGHSFWKIFVPDWFGRIIASHVEMMYQMGCFKNLSGEDFDHGHLIFRQGAGFFYRSSDEFLKNVSMILYHTNEHTHLWQRQAANGIPVEQRIPRSILGFLNRIARPAVEFVVLGPSQIGNYVDCGTIDSFSIRDTLRLFDRESDIYIAIDWKWHQPQQMICIRPFSFGRYAVGKERYDIFIRFILYKPKPTETASR